MLVDIPVAKDVKTETEATLFDKVIEETVEFMAMRLLYVELDDEEEGDLPIAEDGIVKRMMCKELVDVVLACNTLLANYVPSEEERQKLYESVVKKNEARGYYS